MLPESYANIQFFKVPPEDIEGKQKSKCFSLFFTLLLFKSFSHRFSAVLKWRKAHKDFPILKGPKSDNLRAKNRLVNDYTAFPINDNAIADVQGEGPKVEVLSYFNHFAGIKIFFQRMRTPHICHILLGSYIFKNIKFGVK